MEDLYGFIGKKIHELRQNYGGKGLNQEDLAREMETTANTISRWETATYKPSAKELHKLAKFFGVTIATFFPEKENPLLQALMSATGELREDDFQELIRYAQFRAARRKLDEVKTHTKRKK